MPSAGLTKDSWASYRGEKLIDCRCRISGDHKGGQLFRRRLRVPFLLFERERVRERERVLPGRFRHLQVVNSSS